MTYYGSGPQGQFAYGEAAERPRFLNLMVPWAVGLVVNVALQVGVAVVSWEMLAGNDVEKMTTGKAIMLVQLPSAICFAIATWAAAAVHKAPSRDSAVRHSIAAFTPAVLLQLAVFASQGSSLGAMTALVQVAVLLAGCAAGFFLDRLRNG